MEEWLDKVMVEHTCPDCQGARVRATRLLFKVAGRNIHELGQLSFDESAEAAAPETQLRRSLCDHEPASGETSVERSWSLRVGGPTPKRKLDPRHLWKR
jgi:hypothetical protein